MLSVQKLKWMHVLVLIQLMGMAVHLFYPQFFVSATIKGGCSSSHNVL